MAPQTSFLIESRKIGNCHFLFFLLYMRAKQCVTQILNVKRLPSAAAWRLKWKNTELRLRSAHDVENMVRTR
jgi:hypothetical protein